MNTNPQGKGRRQKEASGLVAAVPGESAWKQTLRKLFGIDPRSLALFRIAMAVVLLVDLAIRASDLSAMYTDDGMFPRALIRYHFTTIWNWSFHFGGGSWGFQAMLFIIAAVLALALLVGCKTRFAVIGSWLLLISLQNRVPPILYGGDHILRMLLFWAMFLPLGRTWSVDSWMKTRRGSTAPVGADSPVLTMASGAILIQFAIIYLFSAIFKSNADWFSGRVIAGTLAHDFYAKPLGAHLVQFPQLLALLTYGVLILEWAGPLLLFSPWRTAWVRLAVLASLAAMHLGIELLLTVGLFSYMALAGLILFLPADFWNSRLFSRFRKPENPVPVPPQAGTVEDLPLHYWVSHWTCLFLLIYVLAVNLSGWFARSQGKPTTFGWKFLNVACGLAQKWNMFEDTPSKDGWYVARTLLQNRSEVDLLRRGAPVDWARPAFPAILYPNHRWRQCFREMSYEDELGYQVFRKPVAEYLCRRWNAQHPPDQQAIRFEFIYSIETSTIAANGSKVDVTSRERLIRLNLSSK